MKTRMYDFHSSCETLAFASAMMSSTMQSRMNQVHFLIAVSVVIAGSWVTSKGPSSTARIMGELNLSNSEFSRQRCVQPLEFLAVVPADSSEEALALYALLGFLMH
jgi:hypothetical protein